MIAYYHMTNATPLCQNCKSSFVIEPDDFAFYTKMVVPPPTWCPMCRLKRRMLFTNERNLYRSKCALCSKTIITMYHPDSTFPVYCKTCWWSDKWDSLKYYQSYDFSKPFFAQFTALKNRVPRLNLVQQNDMEKSEYCNRASQNRNSYLCFRSIRIEDCMYDHCIIDSSDCVDCFNITKCELCYSTVDCLNCYHVLFSRESQNCNDSYFLYDCRGCSDCFGCTNLRNKKYYIFNKPYSKEEYFKKLNEMYPTSYNTLIKTKEDFQKFTLNSIHPALIGTHIENVSGNWLNQTNNVHDSFMCSNVENGKYLFFITEAKDCMDYFHFGRGCEQIYETSNCGLNCSQMCFDNETFVSCSNLQYCDSCFTSSDCFGCVGLHNKKFCILNKQYTEQEYHELLKRIIAHMDELPYTDAQGHVYKYGEFFPPEFSPVAYNESVVQEFFPITKEKARATGFKWRDHVDGNHAATIPASQLPQTITETTDEITKQVISCTHEGKCTEQCSGVFKILPQELAYYRKMNIPLPRLCPNCRHFARLKEHGNTVHLIPRACQCAGSCAENSAYKNIASHTHGSNHCQNKFKTIYDPNRSEIIYCEKCYQAEVA